MAEVTQAEIEQLQYLLDEARKQSQHPLVPPNDREARLAFSLADQVLKSIETMKRAIAKDRSIRDAKAMEGDLGLVADDRDLLRLSIASVIHSQVLAIRDGRNREAAATAPADKPVAFHSVMVECFHDETFTVRVESGILQYEGDQLSRCVEVHAYAPAQGRRTAEQAAHDVIVGARMLSKAIADRPLTAVAPEVAP